MALALGEVQLVALLLAQCHEIGRQPLLGRAAGQPLHLVDAVIEPLAEALQHPGGQGWVSLAGGAQADARQPPDGDGAAAGTGAHRIAAMLHEDGGLGHQRVGAEGLEDVFVTLLAEAHHLQLSTFHQQVMGGGISFVEYALARVQRLVPGVLGQLHQNGPGKTREQGVTIQQRDERGVCRRGAWGG